MTIVDMSGGAGRRNCGFVGIPTFLRSGYCADIDSLDAEWAVIGVPLDEGSPNAPGSRFGPRSIREHSLRFPSAGMFDSASRTPVLTNVVPGGRLVDVGDVDILPSNVEMTLQNVTDVVARVRARGAKPLVIGGNHAISYPVVRAFDEPIHVIQLDAHLDYMPVTEELPHTNGQVFRKIYRLPHVQSLTQLAIRGLRNGAEVFRDAEASGSRIIHMPELRRGGPSAALEHLPAGAPCYVSIDIDAFDMPLVPGCASAEPDGLSFEEMSDILRGIAARLDVRGFDLVEVNPSLDVAAGMTSYLAVVTILQFLGQIVAHGAAQPHR